MTRAALYLRVSTVDQHPETQRHDLLTLAQQRGFEIVHEYTDRISGARAKRPGARSVRHYLEVLDELSRLGIEFVSLRENIDTGGALGRAIVVIIGAIAELERSLIIERVRAGMRRAKLEGRHIGRKPLDIDRQAILHDRSRGMSLGELAKLHRVSRTSIARVLKDAVPKGVSPSPLQLQQNRQPFPAA